MKIFIVWRIDFDSMENREPIARSLLGYTCSVVECEKALYHLQHTATTYPGKDGGWGGADTTYPKFEFQEVKQFFPKGRRPAVAVEVDD